MERSRIRDLDLMDNRYSSKNHSSNDNSKPKVVICSKCGRKKIQGRPCSYCKNVIVCPKCGKRYNRKHKGKLVTSCPHCKKSKPKKTVMEFCRNCGKKYDSSLSYCPHCKKSKDINVRIKQTKLKSNSNDYTIIMFLFIGVIIIFIILAMLFINYI